MGKDNPLRNPADHAHYKSRQAREARMVQWYGKEADLSEDTPHIAPIRLPGRNTTLSRRVQLGPLRPWMKRFGLWLLQQEKMPSIDLQCTYASKCAKDTVTPGILKLIKRRKDFQEWYDATQDDLLTQYKERYEQEIIPRAMDAAQGALDEAIANKTLKGVTPIVQQAVDRVMPKKADPNEAPRTVHIHLSGRQGLVLADPNEIVIQPSQIEIVDAETRPAPEGTDRAV